MFKKLRDKMFSFVSDVSSTDSVSSRMVVEKIGSMPESGEINSNFFKIEIKKWARAELNGWLSKGLPFGIRSFVIRNIGCIRVTDGETLCKSKYSDVLGVLEEARDRVDLSVDNEIMFLFDYAYVKWCFENGSLYDIHYRFVLDKLLTFWPVGEYSKLRSNLETNEGEERKPKTMSETILKMSCEKIVKYTLNYMDKDKGRLELTDYIEKKLRESKDGKYKFHIKIILIDQIGVNEGMMTNEQIMLQKRTKKFLSPIVNSLPFFKQTFGIFHVGIELDDPEFYLEWTTCSAVYFKKNTTLDPVLTIDLEPKIITEKNYVDFVDGVISTIYKWNANKKYSLIKSNCQHFVVYLCKRLGVEVKVPEGSFKDYFDKLKQKGNTDLVFQVTDSFSEKFGVGKKDKLFLRHKDLDDYVHKIYENAKEKNIIKEFESSQEWKLLRSFDEIFWIRYFNEEDPEKTAKEVICKKDETGRIDCPFFEKNRRKDEIYEKILEENKKRNNDWYNEYINNSILEDFNSNFSSTDSFDDNNIKPLSRKRSYEKNFE